MLTPEYIVMGLGLILAIWYFIANVYNRRFGLRTYRWLQAGLATLGEGAKGSWIGSSGSGARIAVPRAKPPFERLELIYLLESRELALLWLADILRGKRDQLILRATLHQPPAGEVEVLPARDGVLKGLRRDPAAWTFSDGPHGLIIAQRGPASRQMETIQPFLDQYGANLKRFSWRPQDPHILIVLRLAGLSQRDAAALFQDIRLAGGGKPAGPAHIP